VSDNTVLQVRSSETDGYTAVQVGYDGQKEQRVNQPELGHFKKAGSEPKLFIKEFRTEAGEQAPEVGSKLGADLFEAGQMVDIIGTSKGKGFQGVYKRYGFGGLKQTHGSMMHRRTGSIGAGSTPGRVWKNTQMPGRMGTDRVTIQNLRVVESRPDDNVLLISGAIPGAKGGYIIIRPAIKKSKSADK
jgi:large subunit ribosomal protein L3